MTRLPNIANSDFYGPRIVDDTDDFPMVSPQRANPDTGTPINPPAGGGGSSLTINVGGGTDQSTNSANVVNNTTNIEVGTYRKKALWGVDLDLTNVAGGGDHPKDTDNDGVLIGIPKGNAIEVADVEDTSTADVDVNARIWIKFPGQSVWMPVRAGFILTGFPYDAGAIVRYAAQANKKMYLRGWTDEPIDRADTNTD